MEWIEESSGAESWSFNFDEVLSDPVLVKYINDSAQATGPETKIQILTSRLMKREIILELKKLGLKSSTQSDGSERRLCEDEMIRTVSENNMLITLCVNEAEHTLLKQKVSEFTEAGVPVLLFSSANGAINPLSRG